MSPRGELRAEMSLRLKTLTESFFSGPDFVYFWKPRDASENQTTFDQQTTFNAKSE